MAARWGNLAAGAAMLGCVLAAVGAWRGATAAAADGIKIKIELVEDWQQVEDVNGATKLKRPSPGNVKKFKATVTPADAKVKIRFRLTGVSKEKGTNLNTGDDDKFDALFEQQDGFDPPPEGGQEIVESAGTDNEATVVLTSRDYGPVGAITAEVAVKPDLIEKSSSLSIITDKDENDCEDAWDTKWPGPGRKFGATDDDEVTPKLGNVTGDGFSRYEEYRGFTVAEKFRTLDPKTKDWFAIDVDSIGRSELMTSAVFGGLNVILPKKAEASRTYVMNFNRGRKSAGEMKATPVTNSDETGGSWGLTQQRGRNGEGGPNTVVFCRVWVEKHKRQEKLTRDVRAGQRWLPISNDGDQLWRGEGKVKIEDEIASFEKVQNLDATFYTYTIVLGTKTTLLAKGSTSFSGVLIVLKEGDGEELAFVTGIFNAQGESKLAEDIDATVTEFKVADADQFNYRNLANGYLVIGDEAMTLTRVDVNNDKVTVRRGALDTTAVKHDKNDVVTLPRTFKFDKRAQYGTREIALARGDKAIIASCLIGATRGIDRTAAAAHRKDLEFPIFAGTDIVDKAIAHTFAHEATHTLQAIGGVTNDGHLRNTSQKDIETRVPAEFRFLMDDGQAPGSWPTNGIADSHSPKTLEKLVLK